MCCSVRLSPIATFAMLLAALGCGGGGPNYKTAPVSGRVTLDGQPLANAEVYFFPTAEDTRKHEANKAIPHAHAQTDDQGNYKLKAVIDGRAVDGGIVGENRVTVSLNERNMEKQVLKSGLPRELVPAEYNTNSTLKVTIPPEGKTENFELKGKKGK
jgi:hypothetical protein